MENVIKFYFSKLVVADTSKGKSDVTYLVIKTATANKGELVKLKKNIFRNFTKQTRKEIRNKVQEMARPFVASFQAAPDPNFTYVKYDCSFNKKEYNLTVTARYAPYRNVLDFNSFLSSKLKETLSKSEVRQIYKLVFSVS